MHDRRLRLMRGLIADRMFVGGCCWVKPLANRQECAALLAAIGRGDTASIHLKRSVFWG